MNVSEKFIAKLNEDARTSAMMKKFEEMAEAKNLVGEAYREARKTVVMMAMAMNRDLVHEMADEIWETVNA